MASLSLAADGASVQKIELKCKTEDDHRKIRALEMLVAIEGVVEVSAKENSIVVTGDVDPIVMSNKLEKFGLSDFLSVCPMEGVKKEGEKSRRSAKNKYTPFEYTLDSDENTKKCCVIA
ncbi:hypothetical protein SUGI_0209020 [Cryptomeria japonica]|nr:hypothetical protein SUGI_0209020 [Cryptomeria japonica]